ncbi:MAG: hypothetical protein ACI94Y_001404 [Maribacter sp.]|jgi:hypothetical protein
MKSFKNYLFGYKDSSLLSEEHQKNITERSFSEIYLITDVTHS